MSIKSPLSEQEFRKRTRAKYRRAFDLIRNVATTVEAAVTRGRSVSTLVERALDMLMIQSLKPFLLSAARYGVATTEIRNRTFNVLSEGDMGRRIEALRSYGGSDDSRPDRTRDGGQQ